MIDGDSGQEMADNSYQDTLSSLDDGLRHPSRDAIRSTDFGELLNSENGYQREPYAENVDAGKNTTSYQAHSYWTKVPPQGIMPYIEHFTRPTDLVLDPFCGSGMTGIAALSLDRPRKVILNDLGPAATHIAYNYNTPIEPERLKRAVDEIGANVANYFEWLYTTQCEGCGEQRTIKNTIWSEERDCPECSMTFDLWEPAVIDEKVKERQNDFLRDEFACPGCGITLQKTDPTYDGIVPSRIEYKCVPCFGRKYHLKRLDEEDYTRLREIADEVAETLLWYPTDDFPDGYNTRQPRQKGLSSVDKFYVDRALLALAKLWNEIQQRDNTAVRDKLEFVFTAIATRTTRKHAYRPWGGAGNSATLFVPTFHREQNVWVTYNRKASDIIAAQNELHEAFPERVHDYLRTTTGSATSLDSLPDNSVDYVFTDPPYGQNINYSEMNYVWESWLGRKTNTDFEAIINPKQQKDVDDYRNLMELAFTETNRVLKDNHWMTLVFNNSKAAVWKALQQALTDAGFVTAQFAIFDKQQPTMKQITSDGAVGHDVMVNCLSVDSPSEIEDSLSKCEIVEYIDGILHDESVHTNNRTSRKLYSSVIGHALNNRRSPGGLDYDSFIRLLEDNFRSDTIEIERPYKDIVVEKTYWHAERE